MNHVLSLVRTARDSSAAGTELKSGRMLVELLALHQETLAQLRLERIRAMETVAFLTGMIEQHENAAQSIRVQLGAGTDGGGQARERRPQLREAS